MAVVDGGGEDGSEAWGIWEIFELARAPRGARASGQCTESPWLPTAREEPQG
jgi:hypothetical protein